MEPRGTSLKPSGAGVGGGGGAAAAMVAIEVWFLLACLPSRVGYSFPANAWEGIRSRIGFITEVFNPNRL